MFETSYLSNDFWSFSPISDARAQKKMSQIEVAAEVKFSLG